MAEHRLAAAKLTTRLALLGIHVAAVVAAEPRP